MKIAMNRYLTSLLALLLTTFATSCSTVIDIEYEDADPFYVAVGSLSQEGGSLLLTQSANMDEVLLNTPITTASVVVTSQSGEQIHFLPDEAGEYQAASTFSLTQGESYTLSIEVEEQEFTYTSQLPAAPQIGDVSFSMQQFTADMNLVFCTCQILDPVGEENYFRYRYRYFANDNEESGEPRWSLTRQVVDGQSITIMTHLYTMDRELEEGDVITIEVQAIDESLYNYLYTLSMSGSSATNPTPLYEGGCLGYFSIYSQSSVEAIFSYDDAQ